MTEMRKITAFVPENLLRSAQELTGEGVTETIRIALRRLAHERACRKLLEMQGTLDLEADGVTLQELREDRDFNWDGAVRR